jgi:hypothetical protein
MPLLGTVQDFNTNASELLIVTPYVIERNNKIVEICRKGHNELYEIVNPMEHTTAATESVRSHVPENGDT